MTTLPLRDDVAAKESPVMSEQASPLSALLVPVGGFIEKFGFSTLMAVICLWMLLGDRQTTQAAVAVVSVKLDEHHAETRRYSDETIRILTAQCVNLAADAAQRDRCLGQWPR